LNIGTGTACANQHQNNPKLVMAVSDNFELYRITLRNSPFWHVLWRPATSAGGLTVWGYKAFSPWNVPNTDGIDIDGPNVYVYNSTFGVGDDEIAIEEPVSNQYWPGYSGTLTNVLIDSVMGYGRNGISIGSEITSNVNYLNVTNTNLTTQNVLAVNNSGVWTINGKSYSDINTIFGHSVSNAKQLMPSSAVNIRGLNIKTEEALSGGSPLVVSHILYSDICLKDIVKVIDVEPYTTLNPSYLSQTTQINTVTYKDIHVLASDGQMLNYSVGGGSYESNPQSFMYFINANTAGPSYGFTMNNFTFDDQTGASPFSTLGYATGQYSTFTDTSSSNIYPADIGYLATYSTSPTVDNTDHIHLYISNDTTTTPSGITNNSTGTSCVYSGSSTNNNPFTFLTVDGSVSSGGKFIVGSSTSSTPITLLSDAITVSAMIQPAMSTTGFYATPDYGVTGGLFAIAAPQPSLNVVFQVDGVQIGATKPLSLVGTATSDAYTLTSGPHKITIYYPSGDSYYQIPSWKTYYVTAP
jgi:hypothetical protein